MQKTIFFLTLIEFHCNKQKQFFDLVEIWWTKLKINFAQFWKKWNFFTEFSSQKLLLAIDRNTMISWCDIYILFELLFFHRVKDRASIIFLLTFWNSIILKWLRQICWDFYITVAWSSVTLSQFLLKYNCADQPNYPTLQKISKFDIS